jgi:hypothetical protein
VNIYIFILLSAMVLYASETRSKMKCQSKQPATTWQEMQTHCRSCFEISIKLATKAVQISRNGHIWICISPPPYSNHSILYQIEIFRTVYWCVKTYYNTTFICESSRGNVNNGSFIIHILCMFIIKIPLEWTPFFYILLFSNFLFLLIGSHESTRQ